MLLPHIAVRCRRRRRRRRSAAAVAAATTAVATHDLTLRHHSVSRDSLFLLHPVVRLLPDRHLLFLLMLKKQRLLLTVRQASGREIGECITRFSRLCRRFCLLSPHTGS